MGRMGSDEAFSVRVFVIIMALVLSLCWPSDTAAYAVLAPTIKEGRLEPSRMMAKYLVTATIVAFLITRTVSSRADCTPDSPIGHFQGTGVSKEAGKLVTPVGSGQFLYGREDKCS